MKYSSDKTYWKKWFPVDLVCESFPGQFKNWFYSLLVMSAVLEDTNPMETIFGYASVRDERGEEMHKSKGNAIWFDDAVKIIGADPMRWLYAGQNPAENLGFGYNKAEEVKRKLMTLYNSYVFFSTYVKKEELSEKLLKIKSKNVLDKWIISRTTYLMDASTLTLDNRNVDTFIACVEDFFINDLSLWYIRRSRKRFHEDTPDRKEAVSTFYYVLLNLTKIMAPVMPFFAEEMYQSLKTKDMPESVHLCDWPKAKKTLWDPILGEKMNEVRFIVNLVLAERTAKGIKVKQPLSLLKINPVKHQELETGKAVTPLVKTSKKTGKSGLKIKSDAGLLDLIKDEVNVKEIIFDSKLKTEIELNTEITEELRQEGFIREIIRAVQAERKEQKLIPQDRINIWLNVHEKEKNVIEKNKDLLLKESRADEIYVEIQEVSGDGKVKIRIQKI
jgi:isoleucyl-tRNA synthetase